LLLTPEEKKRNEIENDLLFVHPTNSAYTDLRHLLEVNNGQKITYENPLNISAIIGIPGCIWRDGNDDKVKLIDKSIKAPIPNYRNISDNQVMCVKYRLLILPL
jgi:5'-3' exonuclease